MRALGIDELVGKHAAIVGYTLLTQLQVVVRSIRLAFTSLAQDVGVALDDGSRLSVLRFVEMLGFDLGDVEAAVQSFDDDVAAMAKEFNRT